MKNDKRLSSSISPMSVLVCDNNDIVRAGFTSIIRACLQRVKVCAASNIEELLMLCEQMEFDIIFLDIDLPKFNGVKVIREMRASVPDAKILLSSAYFDRSYIRNLIRVGANGYLSKHATEAEINYAIQTLRNNKMYLNQSVQMALLDDSFKVARNNNTDSISRELLYLISHELTIKQISQCLMVSEKTIEYHRTNLFKTLGAKNMVGLAVYAVKHNIHSDLTLSKKYRKWVEV